MPEPRQLFTQATNPNPYAQPSYPSISPVSESFNNPGSSPTNSSPIHPYNYGQGISPPPPGAQAPYHYPPEKQQSMSVQQPQATYQQQPQPQGVMTSPAPQQSYGHEKAGPPPQGYQQQPAPQQGMNPNVPAGSDKGRPYDANGEREWNNDLLDCFGDCGTCCLAYFCPCIVYQQVKQRLDHLQRNGRPDPEHGGSGCGGDCFLYGALTACCGLGWVFQMGTRSAIRARYRIRGGGCTDCLASCCCIPCELTQESRELELEEGTSH